MNNKVFLLIYDSAYDCDDVFEVDAYEDIEVAKADLKEIADDFKRNDTLMDNDNCVISTDSDTEFTAYENGRYCENHLSVYITEKQIRTEKSIVRAIRNIDFFR